MDSLWFPIEKLPLLAPLSFTSFHLSPEDEKLSSIMTFASCPDAMQKCNISNAENEIYNTCL